MPPLDEGAFLYMPTLMPHSGIGAALEVLQFQDRAISAIPEVESVVGKIGRAETAIDPAPLSMIETLIHYKSEYKRDPLTHELAADEQGRPIRQWREHIKTPADIWREIEKAAAFPGVTGAPLLQPIRQRKAVPRNRCGPCRARPLWHQRPGRHGNRRNGSRRRAGHDHGRRP
jgi:Cu(I)/Ag(I) efflux system membrane protein CusA/SilA